MKKLKYILNSILISFLLFFSSENILIYGMKQELNYNNKLKYGIENISAKINKKLKSKKWALICNNSSIDSLGKRTLDLLLKRNIKIIKIIAPEHGSSGKYLAEHNVPDSKDEITKIQKSARSLGQYEVWQGNDCAMLGTYTIYKPDIITTLLKGVFTESSG